MRITTFELEQIKGMISSEDFVEIARELGIEKEKVMAFFSSSETVSSINRCIT